MDFAWDDVREQANRKKHGLDFRTAAKVFSDPHVIEFDDRDADDELRFNAIGVVDGRMLLERNRFKLNRDFALSICLVA